MLLLDEPTTFLDITHKYGLLELFDRLRSTLDCTIVVVLHVFNQARTLRRPPGRHEGRRRGRGRTTRREPHGAARRWVYELPCRIMPDPETGAPMVIPRAMSRNS